MITPDQNVVDDFGDAFGITYGGTDELYLGTKEFDRDRHRWELDPASAEDYRDRARDHSPGNAQRWRHFHEDH